MIHTPYSVVEKSVMELQADMMNGLVTSEQLVEFYVVRIKEIDQSGPTLRSVLVLNPQAMSDARSLDEERKAHHIRGPLHGIPILVKDNIETSDGTATTAGSLALKENITLRDAPIIQRLKDAGAVILGKTNLTEWGNSRSKDAITGWSALGGLVKNPYLLDRSAGGSSSGTGAAISASLATVGLGTETDGSVVSPSSFCGLVGLKPTVGLIPRTHIIPLAHSQDTPGPMGRSVQDVAILLTAIAGSDQADPVTADADLHRCNYVSCLETASLKGKRLGILSFATGFSPKVDQVFEAAVSLLKAQGAAIFELKNYQPPHDLLNQEWIVLLSELKHGLNTYLATTPAAVTSRSLQDLLSFNNNHSIEVEWFGQDLFERAEKTQGLNDPSYLKARKNSLYYTSVEGIDKLLAENQLDALIAPTFGPAWRIDLITGDHYAGKAYHLPAIAGYPHLTLPMGQVQGLPVGLSFIGPAWSEETLLSLGYAFEQVAKARKPPLFIPSLEESLHTEVCRY